MENLTIQLDQTLTLLNILNRLFSHIQSKKCIICAIFNSEKIEFTFIPLESEVDNIFKSGSTILSGEETSVGYVHRKNGGAFYNTIIKQFILTGLNNTGFIEQGFKMYNC